MYDVIVIGLGGMGSAAAFYLARHGAELRFEEAVLSWEASPDKARVESPKGSYEAEKLVIAPGAWAPQLLQDLGLPLRR